MTSEQGWPEIHQHQTGDVLWYLDKMWCARWIVVDYHDLRLHRVVGRDNYGMMFYGPETRVFETLADAQDARLRV